MMRVCVGWLLVGLVVGVVGQLPPLPNGAPTVTPDPTTSPAATTTTTTTSTTTNNNNNNNPTVRSPITLSSRPMDCTDYLMQGHNTSGVYEIFPFTCTCKQQRVYVWCDMQTDGGGWTVFLSRQKQNKQLEFNRTWEEYKDGFGDPKGEYWLGNEQLHTLTYGRSYTLRQDYTVAGGGASYFTVNTFKVDKEENRYRMLVSGNYKGTTNTFTNQNGRYFTTYDRDNDNYSGGNCAVTNGGGWWHYTRCSYYHPTSNNFTNDLEVQKYNRYYYSSGSIKVTKLQLKLRPNTCSEAVQTIHLTDNGCGHTCH